MNDFMYKYDLFTMNMMGMGKKTRNIYRSKKTKEKSPVWLTGTMTDYILLTRFQGENIAYLPGWGPEGPVP